MLSKIDVQKFSTLVEINSLINSNYTDLNALLTQILESATRLCEGDASSLLLVNKEKQELYFEVALGTAGADVKRFTVKMGEGIAGWVALHNKSIIVGDAENDKRHLKNIPKAVHYTSKTMLAVPMRIKDECLGVIELINKKNGQNFNQEDLEWLEIFANQAGIAVVNARSMEKAQTEIKLLQTQLGSEQGYHAIIAKSPVILEKLEIIDRVAKTDSSVLILGESGVGKEIFAEQIHLRSLRNKEPFVRINCAAIPEGLLESELFGHVKGAFTNAVATRQGRFELADGGTIFLDEIGDLPLALQAKLLRVIQERTFEKVGSDTTVTVDVRILAATNRDIEKQVEKGEFRSDLYYRLNVLPLYIPPLRQRLEDIPELADFFLKKFSIETKKTFEGFSEDAMEAMLSYAWPGNIRELENCIERACVMGKNKLILGGDLFLTNPSGMPETAGERNLKSALTVFKSRFIQKVLEENKWNQTETAKALDIQRTYLSRLVKELDIINPKE
ncbi:sigma-54-dependent Fis family transcriptional regulator [Leadbettera azotonutricia]|uniref:Transcriptional regulator, NifA subfamily, Fis family n=1 Tax=Leadbettera azotonutricia (strain ATCC BAA-888 / DSM 13862 / ZAS-9) TaxID=545695 RepID=F5YC66_LEAAZ|nr:sigma 54-interacting transcriptional regulator [Leadbettera azotonutricia]AEF83230.1 transcriptional regulator, NifA subfamily, Fis family [Leadbettera azotonutricia ZAS-9]